MTDEHGSDTNENNSTKKLFELIQDIDVAMLITLSSEGLLRSRPMATKTIDGSEDLWFLTDRDSAKVVEIGEETKVNVSFSDPSTKSFVSVSGNASVVDDADIVEKIWTPSAEIWFPEGTEDPRIITIKVAPTQAEYWDVSRGVFVNFYKLTRAVLSGERPSGEFSDHAKIDLK